MDLSASDKLSFFLFFVKSSTEGTLPHCDFGIKSQRSSKRSWRSSSHGTAYPKSAWNLVSQPSTLPLLQGYLCGEFADSRTHRHSCVHTHSQGWHKDGYPYTLAHTLLAEWWGAQCGLFAPEVYVNKVLIATGGTSLPAKRTYHSCFITFYVQIKTWTQARVTPANPICAMTSEGGSQGSSVVKGSVVNSSCQWRWWTGSATERAFLFERES